MDLDDWRDISTDAKPVPPRPALATGDHDGNSSTASYSSFTVSPTVSSRHGDVREQRGFELEHRSDGHSRPLSNLRKPPSDWSFNHLIIHIADSLTDSDVVKIKFLFHGHEGIGRKELEKAKSALDLFNLLECHGFINRDNLFFLQAALRISGRMDLVEKAIVYARRVGNVAYLYPASKQPENGYRDVKFHVSGGNFRTLTRRHLQNLQTEVANILFLPREFVIIEGVEPALSMLITLMIPAKYVQLFIKLLESGDHFPGLEEYGVDLVQIGCQVYRIKDGSDQVLPEDGQRKELVNVYQHLQMKTTQVENLSIEIVQLKRKLLDLQTRQLEETKHVTEGLRQAQTRLECQLAAYESDYLQKVEQYEQQIIALQYKLSENKEECASCRYEKKAYEKKVDQEIYKLKTPIQLPN